MKIVKTWDSLNPVVYVDNEAISTRVLEKKYRDTLYVAESLKEYIDAIPEEMAANFPAMPGIDRDYVEEVLKNKA